jgi:hypothetical protein
MSYSALITVIYKGQSLEYFARHQGGMAAGVAAEVAQHALNLQTKGNPAKASGFLQDFFEETSVPGAGDDEAIINIDEGWVEISAADLAENYEHTFDKIRQGIGNPINIDRAKLNLWLTFQITGEAPEDMDEDMENIFPVLRFSFAEAADLFGNPEGPTLPC